MSYSAQNIRNICLLGHGGNGKTTLVESFLRMTGVIDRLGKTTDGNTVCDYDPEEIKRQISISLAMTPVMYNGVKINVMDTPGNFDFAGEMQSGVRAPEVGVLVCASKDGLSVGAERCWKYLKSQNKPCIVYVSKEDEENANFSTTLDALREKLSKSIAPVVAPIWDSNKRTIGIIDVINRKAYQMPENKKGAKRVEIPIPDSKQAVLDELYGELMEAVDKVDSGNLTIDEVMNPQGWILVGFLMAPRPGLGRWREFSISNYQLMEKLLEACRRELGEEPALCYRIGGVIAINAGPNLVGVIYRT